MRHLLSVYLKAFDWPLLAAVFLLSAFGLMEVYSVALGQGDASLANFYKQLSFIGIGVLLLFVFAFIDYRFLKSLYRYIYLLAFLLLISVLLLGSSIRGSKAWFDIAGFGIQPVEIVKIMLLIFLSTYFANLAVKIKSLKHFIYSGMFTALLALLVMMQPDFGSALMLSSVWLVLVVVANFPKRYLISVVSIAILMFILAWSFFFQDYQRQRISTFLNPGENVLAEGYNVSQAIIAVGSGNWYGKGLGFGSQSQLKFLPEAQTDFIFAVIAEELGFLGVMLVLFFFALFFNRCILAVSRLNNDFGVYFILGAMGLIFIQMFINIGMNIGIMPVVGISLPFVSYGGSAIISLFILTGIIQNIIIKSKINY